MRRRLNSCPRTPGWRSPSGTWGCGRRIATACPQHPIAQQRCGVVDVPTDIFGVADDHAHAPHRLTDGRERPIDRLPEAAMEQQVLGRITRQRQLGEQDKIGMQLSTGSTCNLDDSRSIAMHIADQEVVLRQSDPE